MKRVEFFSGVMSCRECRSMDLTTWNARSPVVLCPYCGGPCVPEGPQFPTATVPSAIDGEMYRLETRQRWKAMS